MTGNDDRVTGKAKELGGKLTGNHEMKNEGKAQNAGRLPWQGWEENMTSVAEENPSFFEEQVLMKVNCCRWKGGQQGH